LIVDTHTHLDHPKFYNDVEEVVQRALEAGVKRMIIPGADPKDLPRAQELANRYEGVYFAIGVHPYDIDSYDPLFLKEFAKDPKCVAVGECGLDYYRLPKDPLEKEAIKRRQKEVFIDQMRLAQELDKPLIVHIREASKDAKELLEKYAPSKGGVLHCFNASELLLDLKERFYYGIGGVITFKNAKKLVNILPKIPLSRIVLETDAPYLTPEPYRGKRNEPAYTTFVAKRVGELLNLDYQEVCNQTTQNAKELFEIS